MELIDSEQRARRLARTVTADIVLYNEKRLSAGEDLSREIAEGRSHFCARVSPSLYWIFEEVLNTSALRKKSPIEPAAEPPRIEPRIEPARVEPPPVEPSRVKPAAVEPAPFEPAPFEPAPFEPESSPVEAARAEFAPGIPLSEPPSAVPSGPPSRVEPDMLESELGTPSPSSPNLQAGRLDSERPREVSRARTARVEPIDSPLEQTPGTPSNPRAAIAFALCVIAIAIAVGWFMTR